MTWYLKLSPLSFKDLSAPKVWVRQLILLISPLEMLVSFTCGIPPWPLNIHYISFPRSYSSSCNFLLHVFFPIEGFIRFRIHFNVQHISFTLVFLLKLVYFHRKHISNSTFLSYIWRAASFWRNTMITSLSGLYQNSWASRTVRFLLPVIKSIWTISKMFKEVRVFLSFSNNNLFTRLSSLQLATFSSFKEVGFTVVSLKPEQITRTA